MGKVILKAGKEKSLFYRHPWLFSGALAKAEVRRDGEMVEVCDQYGKLIAHGYYNSQSNIAVRIVQFNSKLTENWLEELLKQAYQKRLALMKNNSFRVVFGESDFLPGLVVDLYRDISGKAFFVFQISTAGMDLLRDRVIKFLLTLVKDAVVVERSDIQVRKLEGLQPMAPVIHAGKLPKSIVIEENGLQLEIDLLTGQKTGFFLDQAENRQVIRKFSENAKVLNLFAYSGGFSLNAALGGAKEVTSVDSSAEAVKLLKNNWELNIEQLNKTAHQSVEMDVFEFLDIAEEKQQLFDLIIVDPPAFVKSRDKIQAALKAYVRINSRALDLLKSGGFLVSSSCSSYLSQELFRGMLFQASLKSNCNLQIVEQRNQPADHPLLLNFPEGEYLKFVIVRKC